MTQRASSPLSLPLAASIAGHVGLVVLLVLFVGRVTPLALPPHPKPAIEIMLAPPPPPLPAAPTPPPPEVTAEPPPPPPLPKQAEPPPPVVHKEPPPPKPLPRSKPVVVRRPPPPRERDLQPAPAMPAPAPYQPALPPPAPAPASPPGPLVSAAYRAALGAWLERHKRYPEGARARGETGQAVLRFHVERSGRVLDYAIVRSTGHPELDAAIEQMMQGAVLPPFPSDMTASDIEVSVALRFALAP